MVLAVFLGAVATADASSSYPWSDPDHPEIDYSAEEFQWAREKNYSVNGWWVTNKWLDELDDSSNFISVNTSQLSRMFSSSDINHEFFNFLRYSCQSDFKMVTIAFENDLGIVEFDEYEIGYRIDKNPPEYVNWFGFESNSIAIVGISAAKFMNETSEGKSIYIRLSDQDGKDHDMRLNLAGTKKMLSESREACK